MKRSPKEGRAIVSLHPDWKISVRVIGPAGTVSKKMQKRTTCVHPNKGVTLQELLDKLGIKVDNPDVWEMMALKHRIPEERARKSLYSPVKDMLMHYHRKITGHFCFYLRPRAATSGKRYQVRCYPAKSKGRSSPSSAHRAAVINNGRQHPRGRGIKTTSDHGRSQASLPPNLGSGLETWKHSHQQTHQHEDGGRITYGGIRGGSGRFYAGETFITNARLEDQCSFPKHGRDKLAAGTSKVNIMHVVNRWNAQQASGARTSAGAVVAVAHGRSQYKGYWLNALPDKPNKQHCLVAVAVQCEPNSDPYNENDLAKKYDAMVLLK